jgi:hypothetical protein
VGDGRQKVKKITLNFILKFTIICGKIIKCLRMIEVYDGFLEIWSKLWSKFGVKKRYVIIGFG